LVEGLGRNQRENVQDGRKTRGVRINQEEDQKPPWEGRELKKKKGTKKTKSTRKSVQVTQSRAKKEEIGLCGAEPLNHRLLNSAEGDEREMVWKGRKKPGSDSDYGEVEPIKKDQRNIKKGDFLNKGTRRKKGTSYGEKGEVDGGGRGKRVEKM